jgi:acyl-CoA thioesterase I
VLLKSKMKISLNLLILFSALSINCSSDRILLEEENFQEIAENTNENAESETTNPQNYFKILALGDSYTIGESVCDTCRFPEQLKQQLISETNSNKEFELKIIALSGWTTNDLLRSLNTQNDLIDYDLVTLLIGVNNQAQNYPFSTYETEFPQLIAKAILYAKSNKNNLVVISIPDYAFTPFGDGNSSVSADINKYNDFAQNYCITNNITFINITDISRMGFENPSLVASDGLHPSELAYSKFVERILPIAIQKLKL